jgi:NAD(P)-dependent dehydrogenase (short-subunit alcohol dehydrogenase family)
MNAATTSALVTGGGRGLGRVLALGLADAGFGVGVLARTAAEVEATVREIRDRGGRAVPLVADVRDGAAVERSARRLREELGPVGVLVAAAGQLRGIGPVGAAEAEGWWADFETPTRGLWNAVRAVLPDLRQAARPAVVTLVGPGLNGPLAHGAGYAAAQAAVARLVECLAAEWAKAGIPIYAVNPGIVPTALMNGLLDSPEGRRWLPGFTEAFAEGKEVDAGYVARMVAWLVAQRPAELSGRVVPALLDPELLALRLGTIRGEDRHVLRLG